MLMALCKSADICFKTSLVQFPWRNGYFYDLSQAAAKVGKPDPCPLHSKLLKETGSV